MAGPDRERRDVEQGNEVQGGKRFPLLRYYLATSFVVITLVAVTGGFLFVNRAESIFAERSSTRGSVEARNISQIFYYRIWAPRQQQHPDLTLQDVIDPKTMDTFTRRNTLGLDIVTLKLLDLDGNVLWGNAPADLRDGAADSDSYETVVREGTYLSGLRTGETFNALNGEERQLDVVRTYYPIRDVPLDHPREGRVVGVLEITQDVTADLAASRRETLLNLIFGSGSMGVILFTLLFLIVFRADRIIARGVQELGGTNLRLQSEIEERRQAETALSQTNLQLEETLEQLRDTQQQVVQQERMRALGQMASGIAHDFNNALGPIVIYLDLLLHAPNSLDNQQQVRQYLETMNTAATDAANVVKRLREFYRERDQDQLLEEVDLKEMVNQSVALTQPRWRDQALGSGITIDVETDLQDLSPIPSNASDLREVMTNLIINAVDAMPSGGTITIRTYLDGEHVGIDVSDTGTGMTEEVRRRCMEPFFSSKGERGSGLGLSMVYGIIGRHEGTIDIDSEEGKGTTFMIRLPTQRKEGGSSQTEQAVVAGPVPALNILVVDDDVMGRDALTASLRTDHHTVDPAANGREALEKFRAGSYDLVVTDRAMPEMNGDQLAAAIKEVAPDQLVIMVTGFGDIMEASGETVPNVDLVLSKPVNLTRLREALMKLRRN